MMVVYYEARVLFDYDPVNADELRLRKGEPIEVRVDPNIACEEGWLTGSNIRGQHGVFPANYVVDKAQHPNNVACDENRDTEAQRPDKITPSSKPSVDPAIRGSALEPKLQQQQRPCSENKGGDLPEKWYSATDEATGIEYYYTDDGQSSWVKPTPALESSGGRVAAAATRAPNPNSVDDTLIAEHLEVVRDTHQYGTARQGKVDVMATHICTSAGQRDRKQLADIEQATIRIQAAGRGRLDRRKFAEQRKQPQKEAQEITDNRSLKEWQSRNTQDISRNGGRTKTPDESVQDVGGPATGIMGSPTHSMSEILNIDKRVVRFIAELVDERMMVELRRRDTALEELKKKISLIVDNQAAVSSSMDTAPKVSGKGSQTPSPRKSVTPPLQSRNNHARDRTKPSRTGKNPLSDLHLRVSQQRVGSPGLDGSPNCFTSPSHPTSNVFSPPPTGSGCNDNGDSSLMNIERSLSPLSNSQPLRVLSQDTAVLTTIASASVSGGEPLSGHSVGFSFPLEGGDIRRERTRGSGSQNDAGLGVSTAAPRVADVEGNNRKRVAIQEAKAAEAAALVKRSPRGRTALYNPSWHNPEKVDTSAPESELQLEYVHGYAGEMPTGGGGIMGPGRGQAGKIGGARQAATRSTNVLWLRTGEVVFPASAVVVLHNFETNRQRFFKGHDEEVTALAVHPHEDVVASGQAGKEGIVCLFDASRKIETGQHDSHPDSVVEAHAEAAVGLPPVFLRELSLGKKEKRGVAALDFSADGNLILAMAGGDGQTLSILDWRNGVRLVTARAESAFLCAHCIRFNPCLYLSSKRAETAGLAPGEACYTLVSCGERHVRFWTLSRAWCARTSREDDWRVERKGGDGRWMWSLNSRPGNFRGRGEIDNMTCVAFIGEPGFVAPTPAARNSRLPLARTVTGAENGQIYFWEVLEEDPQTIPRDSHANDALLTAIGWKPCGRLLAVVPNAHDGPLTDMCYLQRVFEHESSSLPRGTTSSSFWGTLATCGTDGTLRLWAVAGHGRSPLELLVTVEVSTRGVGIGHARSVSWDRSGTTIALGTAGNAVCLVQPGTEIQRGRSQGPGSVLFMLAVQGHTGSCRALAPHPSRPWFVTGGTDRILRLWDARSRRQLSAARLLEKVCSVAFHPTGNVLAVGSEAGDFLLMTLRVPAADASGTPGEESGGTGTQQSVGFCWDVLARKRIVLPRGFCSRGPPRSDVPGRSENDTQAGTRGGGGRRSPGTRPGERGQRQKLTAGTAGARSSSGRGRGSRYHPTNRRRGDDTVSSLSLSPGRSKTTPRCRGTSGVVTTGAAGVAGGSPRAVDVSALRFSPDGEVLAAACGNCIHLYLEFGAGGGLGAYRRYGVCTGHGTTVKSMDFSSDSSVLQSNDASKELLFWEVTTGKQISNAFSVRDIVTASWSCPAGWLAQGLANGVGGSGGVTGGVRGGGGIIFGDSGGRAGQNSHSQIGEGIVAVCQSNAGDVLAASDEDNCVNLARSPAPEGAVTRANWGHSSVNGIPALSFLCDDRRLVSAGGTYVFVWSHGVKKIQIQLVEVKLP